MTRSIDYFVAPDGNTPPEEAAFNFTQTMIGPGKAFMGTILDMGHLMCSTEEQSKQFRKVVFGAYEDYKTAVLGWIKFFALDEEDFVEFLAGSEEEFKAWKEEHERLELAKD